MIKLSSLNRESVHMNSFKKVFLKLFGGTTNEIEENFLSNCKQNLPFFPRPMWKLAKKITCEIFPQSSGLQEKGVILVFTRTNIYQFQRFY